MKRTGTEDSCISKQFTELIKARNLSLDYVAKALLTRRSEIEKFFNLPKNKRLNNDALYKIYFLADRVTDCVHCEIAQRLKRSCIEEIESRH